MRNTGRLGTLGLAVILAACSNDAASPTSASTVNSDVASFTAEAVGQDVEFMHGPAGRFGLGIGFWGNPARFECTSVELGGYTAERTCTFYDADGVAQDAYDSLTTASANLHVSITGSFDRGDWGSSSFSRERDVTVTGLEGQETSRTWNGTSSGSMTGVHTTRDSSTVQMDVVSTGSVTDLVIPYPRTETSWPSSGTIAYSMSVTFTGGPHDGETKTRDVTVTFDGTQYATVTVNGETFTLDLAQRRCSGGHGGDHHPDGHGGGGEHD